MPRIPKPFRYLPVFEGIGHASLDAVAKDAVQSLAEDIADKARELARAEGLTAFADAIRVETTQRPKGRGQVQVIADDPHGEAIEYGDGGDTERRRILGRAAGVQINTRGNVTGTSKG